jgi:uridine kinase
MHELAGGQPARIPRYDFRTHCRLRVAKTVKPKPLILVDGLWLLHRPALRRLFTVSIFLDCPKRVRFQRRLARDLKSRGRSRLSVLRQFRGTVEPMHLRYVVPQARWADVVVRSDGRLMECRVLPAPHLL